MFIQHTSASLLISENADPAVGRDLERFMQRIAPDGSPDYEHDAEGPGRHAGPYSQCAHQHDTDDSRVTGTTAAGHLAGVYLWEHRHAGHSREVIVTVVGSI